MQHINVWSRNSFLVPPKVDCSNKWLTAQQFSRLLRRHYNLRFYNGRKRVASEVTSLMRASALTRHVVRGSCLQIRLTLSSLRIGMLAAFHPGGTMDALSHAAFKLLERIILGTARVLIPLASN